MADLHNIAGQDSWTFGSADVEVAVTKLGGMMAPVSFYRDSATPVQPYYINPWHGERRSIDIPVLIPLRGDFFCMPFGAGGAYRDERYPAHGESATAEWQFESLKREGEATIFEASMALSIRRGRIEKRIALVEGHNCLYIRHRIEGAAGPICLGHHATLHGAEESKVWALSLSPYRFGRTWQPAEEQLHVSDGEYYSLAQGEWFESIDSVPSVWKSPDRVSCAFFPLRRGFVDILMVSAAEGVNPGWTIAHNRRDGYLWYSLKDTSVLPSTLLWMEHFGRHQAPWDGRNSCLGLEEVCAYMAGEPHVSIGDNPVSVRGVRTAQMLSEEAPLVVNTIQGVVRVPPDFTSPVTVRFGEHSALFRDARGTEVATPVDHRFVVDERGERKTNS